MTNAKLGFDPVAFMAEEVRKGLIWFGKKAEPVSERKLCERTYQREYKRRWRENRRRLHLPV